MLIYLVFGIAFRKFVGGASGFEVVPNLEFWQDIPVLIKVSVFLYLYAKGSFYGTYYAFNLL